MGVGGGVGVTGDVGPGCEEPPPPQAASAAETTNSAIANKIKRDVSKPGNSLNRVLRSCAPGGGSLIKHVECTSNITVQLIHSFSFFVFRSFFACEVRHSRFYYVWTSLKSWHPSTADTCFSNSAIRADGPSCESSCGYGFVRDRGKARIMYRPGNKLLVWFLIFSFVFFLVAVIVEEFALFDSGGSEVQPGDPSGGLIRSSTPPRMVRRPRPVRDSTAIPNCQAGRCDW